MMKISVKFLLATALAVLTAIAAAPQRADAQNAAALLNMLEKEIETKPFRELGHPVSLSDVVQYLVKEMKNRGLTLPIQLDSEAFKIENPDAPDTYDTRVEFPPVPEKMSVSAVLRHALSKVPTKNATFVVMPDVVMITTFERARPEHKLNEPVMGIYENRPLAEVVRDIADKIGTTIVIDHRAAEKAKTEVSATFLNNVSLAGALRVLTEMTELKVVMLDGGIMVTTPEHVEVLRKELRDKKTPASGKQVPGVPGGFPSSPGFNYGFDVDPLWPYIPNVRRDPIAK